LVSDVAPWAVLALSGVIYKALRPARLPGPAVAADYGRHLSRGCCSGRWRRCWDCWKAAPTPCGAGGRTPPLPDLLRDILRIVIYLVAAFVILRGVLGHDISTLLTSTALLTARDRLRAARRAGQPARPACSMHLVRSVVPSDWIAVAGVGRRSDRKPTGARTRLRTNGDTS